MNNEIMKPPNSKTSLSDILTVVSFQKKLKKTFHIPILFSFLSRLAVSSIESSIPSTQSWHRMIMFRMKLTVAQVDVLLHPSQIFSSTKSSSAFRMARFGAVFSSPGSLCKCIILSFIYFFFIILFPILLVFYPSIRLSSPSESSQQTQSNSHWRILPI